MAIGITDWDLPEEYDGAQVRGARTSRNGTRTVTVDHPRRRLALPRIGRPERAAQDQAGRWLRNAMIALGVLAVSAAAVSYWAQFVMVHQVKGTEWAAAVEAGIPDVSAAVFAGLGIALALQGKRALRARALNLGAVATSVYMNYLAAGDGWRNTAIYVMPAVAYALASDTAIGVVRAWAIARQRQLDEGLADEGTTPLDVLGGSLLWVLRLSLAPASTLTGFRAWVVTSCPVAPGTRAQLPVPQNVAALPAASTPPGTAAAPAPAGPAARTGKPRSSGQRGPSKTARFMALVAERFPGGLATIDPADVSKLCAELAPQVDLDAGAARSYLTPRVREAIQDRVRELAAGAGASTEAAMADAGAAR